MTQEEWMEKLKGEGYKNLTICASEPNTDFGEHTHDEQTVHVILKGDITLIDAHGSVTIKPGQQFDILAGTKHTAHCGAEGCVMIVGTK